MFGDIFHEKVNGQFFDRDQTVLYNAKYYSPAPSPIDPVLTVQLDNYYIFFVFEKHV